MTNQSRIGVIYMYTSPSGKFYIGQTIREAQRKIDHKNKTIKSNSRFGTALRKYGYENFEYKVLIKFKPTVQIEKLKRVLNKLEQRYIAIYKSSCSGNGYNLTEGGGEYCVTEELRQKLSTAAKKKFENGIPDYILKALEKAHQDMTPKDPEEARRNRSAAKDKVKVKVKQYDLENNFITEFESIEEAARSIEGRVHKTVAKKIGECCNGKRATIYGFIWKRE